MPNTSRLFFALWPNDATRQTLAQLNRHIPAKKQVDPHNLHVTLVFLGQVDAKTESVIEQLATDITVPPFELTFDNLSYWRRPKVLCLTCRQDVPEEAMLLTSALTEAAVNCGLKIDTRTYTPHITLARHARHLPDVKIDPIVWRAEAFCLVQSCSEPTGVNYKVIQQWPLLKTSKPLA